jgi:exodeoxyribonuclease III
VSGPDEGHARRLAGHSRQAAFAPYDRRDTASICPQSSRHSREPPSVKIATYNINNINRRLDGLLVWLKESKPDIVCLQELKVLTEDFPEEAIARRGYGAIWLGQKQWNGVAILAKDRAPELIRARLPGDPTDRQSRYIEGAIKGIVVASIYLPNGNPQPGPKFDYKLAWMKRLRRHAKSLLKAEVPVVLAGDYNVAPTDIDIYPTASWDDDALVQPESRNAFRSLIDDGWLDAVRAKHPTERLYTYWDYMRRRWERDAGLRLDHILLSPVLAPRLKKAGVDRFMRGRPTPSDHAPAWAELTWPSRPAR